MDTPNSSDAPPPAYQLVPKPTEQPLDFGPNRPFQPVTHQPPSGPPPSTYQAPSGPPPPPRHPSSTASNEFWNGSNLSQQQTGFVEGAAYPHQSSSQYLQNPSQFQQQQNMGGYEPRNDGYMYAQQQHHSPQPVAARPPAARPTPTPSYQPTATYTPGQPLLNRNRLLIFPVGFTCSKCSNTGYKENDPTHPCRKCWEKHGRPYTGALLFAPNSATPASNFQRPIKVPAPPRPTVTQSQYPGRYQLQPQQQMGGGGRPLVVQPGDPRIGGQLCMNCYGRGLTEGFFSDDTCYRCRGSGRVF